MQRIIAVAALSLALAPSAWSAQAGGRCSLSDAQACGGGEYCQAQGPPQPGQQGTCAKKPDMCMMIWKPVCGVDGKTYPNVCHAARAGVNVAQDGACPDH